MIWDDDFLEKKKLNKIKILCENTFSVCCSKYVFLKTMILISFVGDNICTNDFFLCVDCWWIGIWKKEKKNIIIVKKK